MYNRSRRNGYTNWFQLITIFALGMLIGQLFNLEIDLEPRDDRAQIEQSTQNTQEEYQNAN